MMFTKDKEDLGLFYRGHPLHICPLCGKEFRFSDCNKEPKSDYVKIKIDGFTKTIDKNSVCSSLCSAILNIMLNNDCSYTSANKIWLKRIGGLNNISDL